MLFYDLLSKALLDLAAENDVFMLDRKKGLDEEL